MSITRREFLEIGGATIAAALLGGCLPKPETPTPTSSFTEAAFGEIFRELQSGNCVTRSNLEPGRFIYLNNPDSKLFFDSPTGTEPAYGEVISFYREYQNPDYLWPLAQEYRTSGFLNVFLIGAYQDFPQEARTLKIDAKGKVSAEAKVTGVLVDGNNEFSGIEIQEMHYGADGRVAFSCTSQFNADLEKIGETNIEGNKLEEYYFLWPVKTQV